MSELSHMVVLVVDDEPTSREVLAHQLYRLQVGTVLKASSVREALKLAEQFRDRIDLVITDFAMPELTGSDFIAMVRCGETALEAGIKLVLYSSFANTDVVVDAQKWSIDGVVAKPISLSGMSRVLRRVVDSTAPVRHPSYYMSVRLGTQPEALFPDLPMPSETSLCRVSKLTVGAQLVEPLVVNGVVLVAAGVALTDQNIGLILDYYADREPEGEEPSLEVYVSSAAEVLVY